ncbi:MAG: hypothetical protein J2P37_14885 [Ktedonobacteraceae bacterium]|nr:hypothetical protein [Ktedonobacteraceae bacterium]MBO0792292.1 hypothetical protein [Ktedonobacteraceae bacterium]
MNTSDDEDHLTPEERAFAHLVSERLDLFALPTPPDHLTPRMAQIALRRLIHLDQQLGLETMKVMMGVHRLDEALGRQMVDFIPKYFGPYQGEIKAIIDQLEGMAHEHDDYD